MRSQWRSATARLSLACVLMAVAVQVPAQESDAGLTVEDHGVGSAIVDRNLEERKDTFVEGERAVFWTLVEGGDAGDRVAILLWVPDDFLTENASRERLLLRQE
jgi:hypothetical protein